MDQSLQAAEAALYGQFVKAAYSMYFSDPNSLTPAPKDVPAGYALAGWIQMSDFAFGSNQPRFYGFIAKRTDSDAYVLAIRGTEGITEWYDDAICIPVPFSQAPEQGHVALGFDKIYKSLQVAKPGPVQREMAGSFAQQVDALAREISPRAFDAAGPSFVVTGHSLGAALCTLYTMENASKGSVAITTLCTFASPRVGNGDFVTAFGRLPLRSWRIVNDQDIVPKLPPGFTHVNTAYPFDSQTFVKWSPECWHSMDTYIAWLDPSHAVEPQCSPRQFTAAPGPPGDLAAAAPH